MKQSSLFLKAAVVVCVALVMGACAQTSVAQGQTAESDKPDEQAGAPNIVFILADDLGISDIAAYASHFTGKDKSELYYETPNMDKLAEMGISFSQAYGSPNCSPARSALMSGMNAARVGFTTATPMRETYFNQNMPVPEGRSPHDVLEHKDPIREQQAWINASSNTGIDPSLTLLPEVLDSHYSVFLGKWHLGGHGVKHLQPVPQGFDEAPAFFDAGGSQYHYSQSKAWSGWPLGWNSTKPPYETMNPETYDIGDAGVAPHADYLTDDLTDRAVNFISKYSQDKSPEKKPFLLYFSHFAVHTPFEAPSDLVSYYETKPERGTLGHDNAVYAGMVSRLDASVGRIMDVLEASGLDKNTLVVLTSDNGGAEYTNPVATDNAPFKGGKGSMYEGGIRVPLVVYMPEKFEGGTWRDQVVAAVDHMPTLAALTGNEVPDGIEGQSLIPVLEDATFDTGERPLIWHYPFNVIVKNPNDNLPLTPYSGIRKGEYKMLWNWHGKLELYNLVEDPFENRDLASEMPKRTEAMFKELHSWLLSNVDKQYMPILNKHYDPEKDERPYPFKDLSGELTK